jgi:glycosyltransferase involved in cell wall biosynthesis
VLAEICRSGAASGWEQLVLRPFAGRDSSDELQRLCAPVPVMSSGWKRGDLGGAVRAVWWTRSALENFRPDIIHAHLFHASLIVAALHSNGAVRVLTHHNGSVFQDVGPKWRCWPDRWATRRYDHVVGVSDAVSEFLRRDRSVDSRRLSTIRNGWSGWPLPPEPEPGLVISVGNFRAEKGHDLLLRAFAIVASSHENARLVLVGDGPLRKHLEEMALSLGLDDRVDFVGHVDNVWPYLQRAAVFAQPSRSEPLGIAVLEAMAAGRPVVAAATGGLTELVSPETGILVRPNDVNALADAILVFLRSPALADTAGATGRKVAAAHTAEQMVSRYTDLYASLSAQREVASRGHTTKIVNTISASSVPDGPTITIGIPVRNGARTLRQALDSCLRQTCRDIEVVVSDNASTDETSRIIEDYRRRDPRVRLLRQDLPVSMWENHRATFEAARGKYFMWGADDDILGDDWVGTLLGHLERNPDVGLAYGSLRLFNEHDDVEGTSFEWPVTMDSRDLPTWRRILMDKQSGYPAQGLFRRDLLQGYEWWEHTISPDWPFLVFMLVRTNIVQFGGPILYRTTNTGGSGWERSVEQSYRQMESCPTIRLSWRCALAARAAGRAIGQRRIVPLDALLVAWSLLWANRRYLFRWQVEGWQRSTQKRLRKPSDSGGPEHG